MKEVGISDDVDGCIVWFCIGFDVVVVCDKDGEDRKKRPGEQDRCKGIAGALYLVEFVKEGEELMPGFEEESLAG